MATCTFQNDTSYRVIIVDHDGTRTLHPGQSENNYLVKGFSLKLVLKLSDTNEVKKEFSAAEFENRTHKISKIFAEHINSIKVLGVSSKWKFIYNHPGGNIEEKVEVQIVTKNSWKNTTETETEFEAKLGAKIKAIEMSTSFKHKTKLTRVDGCEHEIKETRQRTFKDRCYLWQEFVVIQTDQPPPYDILEIPTPHVEQTPTAEEPGKDVKFIYIK